MIRVATDVGGTFTDFAAYDDSTQELIIAKTSTTERVVDAIVTCFEKAKIAPAATTHFFHGNTIAINTVIEEKGAVTGLLTTKGFRDILELGRGNIHNSFDLMFDTPRPLVPRRLRLEADERMVAGGVVLKELNTAQAGEAIQELLREGAGSIAICLLHAYANPDHELRLKTLVNEIAPGAFVTASSDLSRQYREFERTSTTVLNAYVGPRSTEFFNHLEAFLTGADFRGVAMIMQSNGGTMPIETAKRQPVRTMESGPVGGTIAAAYVGKKVGYDNVVAFDMGGTTAKVSIVREGKFEIADGYVIGTVEMGYSLQLPVIDILEVGSGGGSIAHLDEMGLLKVGPVSAGAVPGPVCYGRGGDRPTVTDANVVLGRLSPAYFLGGEIELDADAARAAIENVVAKPLAIGVLEAALGIVRVADASMAHAVRIMTVQKGHDPRDFVLFAYGGGGPGHACSIARELGIGTVVIPPYPGIFSAIGMLLSDAKESFKLSRICRLADADDATFEALFGDMEREGRERMRSAGFDDADITYARAVEMRYSGQEFTLRLPFGGGEPDAFGDLHRRFAELHALRYGHAFESMPSEIVDLIVEVYGHLPKPVVRLATTTGPVVSAPSRRVYFEDEGFIECRVCRRDALAPGTLVDGPLIVEEATSTTLIHPGDSVTVDAESNLVITVGTFDGISRAATRWAQSTTR
jgi:N-methylhydantoinase A